LKLSNGTQRVLTRVADGHVGAELLGRLEPRVGQVDGHDVARAEQPRAGDRGQANRPGADHGDDVAGAHAAGQHADLVSGRQDVGQHEGLLVADPVRDAERGVVRVQHAGELGLGAVDRVAEDPAAAFQALPVAALTAELAGPAGADAGDEHAVAGDSRRTPSPNSHTVPTASWRRTRLLCTTGTSPLRMCRSVPQMVVASIRTMASPWSRISGSGTSSQAFRPGPW
jgi:hypothetical protein